MKRSRLLDFSILLASLVGCALALEAVSRILFDPPPSVVVENLSEPRASDKPIKESEKVELRDGQIYSKGVPDSGFYVHSPTGRRLRRGVRGAITSHHLSRTDVPFSTNSIGYRDDEVGPKRERELRILALGDSITLGDYVAQDETYPEYLERALNASGASALDGREVRVINAGVGAIDLQNEFAILMETGLSVEPDVVLVGLFLNDAYHSPVLNITRLSPMLSWSHFLRVASMWLDVLRAKYDYEGTGLRSEEVIERARTRFVEKNPIGDGDWRTDDGAFNALIAKRIGGWGYGWTDDFWAKVVPIFELIQQVGNDHDFRLAVMMFPLSYQVQSELLRDEPQRQFARYMSELGIPHYDLLPLLREKYRQDGENVFYDFCHYRAEGHAFFAPPVAEFLLTEVISR